MKLEDNTYYQSGATSCQTCLWSDQCASDEICEHYDCIDNDVYTCSSSESYEDYKITWLEYIAQYSDNPFYGELLN